MLMETPIADEVGDTISNSTEETDSFDFEDIDGSEEIIIGSEKEESAAED